MEHGAQSLIAKFGKKNPKKIKKIPRVRFITVG
jgi:hypothetical protein